MPNPIASSVGSSAKTLAQQIAKQMAQEPLELLKNAREQTTGEELSGQPDNFMQKPLSPPVDQQKALHEQQLQQDNMRSNRLIDALNRELADIHKQKIFKELQEKIMNGEFVALEEYTELSMEQKQVLKAQMEAVKNQRANMVTESAPLFTASKPGRKMGSGQKQKAQQEQQQRTAELQMQQMEVDNLTKVAYAHSQEGLAKERVAKIQTDSAVAQDKLRRAHQEDTASLLNVVKALKELKGMDLDHLMQQVQILNTLSPAANPEEEVVAS